MASAHDVASYILERRSMSAMKMQKLAYYAQAWHLARTGDTLFDEHIEAWVNGPVVRDLYREHRGQFSVHSWPTGDPEKLSKRQRALLDEIIETYGDRDARWLSELTHNEEPWKLARMGLPDDARSSAVIDLEQMRRFYAEQEAVGRGPAAATS